VASPAATDPQWRAVVRGLVAGWPRRATASGRDQRGLRATHTGSMRIVAAVAASLASAGFVALWLFETVVRGGTCDYGKTCSPGLLSYASIVGAVACFVVAVALMLGDDSDPRP